MVNKVTQVIHSCFICCDPESAGVVCRRAWEAAYLGNNSGIRGGGHVRKGMRDR